ncbi:MAG: cytochrome P450 [Pseudomonadota bacterium]
MTTVDIDVDAFWHDPYPQLAALRHDAPVAWVPQLRATLLTRHADVVENEKRVEVFSSSMPNGLMTRLMGENLMRKDGDAHFSERRAIMPALSVKAVRTVWRAQFAALTDAILDALVPCGACELVQDLAMPVSAEALKAVTGLANMSAAEMDRVSQGMIDGCANYSNDPDVEAHCHDCTASITEHIAERQQALQDAPDHSMLSMQLQAGLSDAQIDANIKLAISGGQNEPRDAIAGTVWALLRHPEQLAAVRDGAASWLNAFEEYARWVSPIGMSPRRLAQPCTLRGVDLNPDGLVFFMFGSANRDEAVFEAADTFDVTRNHRNTVSFGAGPHFCAGAWVSRCLIAEVVLPRVFARLPNLRVQPDAATPFGGWAFRGPLSVPVCWDAAG